MNFFFQIQILELMFCMDNQKCMANLDCFFIFSFTISSKLIIFCIALLYCYILPLLFHVLQLCLFHMHIFSIESIDYILLSSFELKAILFIDSVGTLCLSLLKLCCVLNIDLSFPMNSLWFPLVRSISILFFFQMIYFILNIFFIKYLFY